ncbi:N-acetylmuramoyl-L-alanine amidase [Motilibacter rhizosphaerae]|uniref:N-acetylmuramoyl-L-alanine amidase n=1 Tax=Motilibacter rhizosphaerae TaxID=598652 RepID=A0A4Q7NSS2_9ACTN|nr:peptidoglycan recognition protein [Motilibacter rhizosphaerae]RZS90193.1 N-acetylmuramoyl-L-alanine amidase [Motilibacter rhizosphaerae]
MRPTSALLAVALVPAALALPTVTAPAARAHAVAPHLASLPLAGVDRGALQALPPGRAGRAPVVLTPQERTSRFDLLALSWDAGTRAAGTRISVRVREAGRWTSWQALDDEDAGPDAGSADDRAAQAAPRESSGSLLTGGSDGLQVRVDGTRVPGHLRAELVDGGRSRADTDLAPQHAASTAAADAAQPTIVTRAQWGADESLRGGSTPRYTAPVQVGFVHHTDSVNTYSPADAAAQVRAIYAYHTKVRHWSDIGYNYLVDQYGTLYEGRAGGIDKDVLGAHTGGFNTGTFAVSALGNFQTAPAPDAMVASIERLMAWRLSLAHRDPLATTTLTSEGGGTSRYRSGAKVTVDDISGHRDVGATDCPGDDLYARLPEIRNAVAGLMGPSVYEPAASPTTVPGAADGRAAPGTVAVTARTSDPQQWLFTVAAPDGTVVATTSGATVPGALGIATAWDRTVAGQPAPAGTYVLTLAATSPLGPVRSWTRSISVGTVAPPPPAASASPAPAPVSLPEPPTISVVYTSDGERQRSGRQWRTTCIDYRTTHRCSTSTTSSYYTRTSYGKIVHVIGGWVPGAFGYSVRWAASLDGDPYTTPGTRTIGSRQWQVTCNQPTGPRICNASVRTTVWARVVKGGKVGFRAVPVWKLSRVYRLYVNVR